jgi:hypothetical protein
MAIRTATSDNLSYVIFRTSFSRGFGGFWLFRVPVATFPSWPPSIGLSSPTGFAKSFTVGVRSAVPYSVSVILPRVKILSASSRQRLGTARPKSAPFEQGPESGDSPAFDIPASGSQGSDSLVLRNAADRSLAAWG